MRRPRAYGGFKHVHLILDNYCIHRSKATREALEALAGKFQLHFLPPYCPRENKMELIWLHLHRNVTCNHRCDTIEQLIEKAEDYLAESSQIASHGYLKAA